MPNIESANEKPIVLPVRDVVKRMMEHKEILIITGAGVSAPSGIPTFRGINGLYDKKFEWEGKEY
jgi:NAD-dependent deacetylase